jgi:hypothetical protein
MNELDLRCKTQKKFKATTNSKHDLPIANNILKREFDVKEPNKVGSFSFGVVSNSNKTNMIQ